MSTVSLRVTGLDKIQTGFNRFASTLGIVTREQAYHALELAVKKSPAYQGGSSYNVPLPPWASTGAPARWAPALA